MREGMPLMKLERQGAAEAMIKIACERFPVKM